MTESGALTGIRSGSGKNSTIKYSRFDIEALKMAEKMQNREFVNATLAASNNFKRKNRNGAK